MDQNNELYKLMMGMGNFREDKRRESYERAPFPYPGGKSKSLDCIIPHLPYRNTYIEPFGGSGSVLLARNPSPLEVFNDRYGGVVSFYRVIRNRVKMDALLDRLSMVLHSREEFIWCRDTWKDCTDEVERAARWWYMVTCSFAGLGLNFGRAKKGNQQFGSKLKNNLRFFDECNQRLERVQIENMHWADLIRDYNHPDAVWYLDPPYYKTQEGQYECEFTEQDHIDLIMLIPHIKGFIALSGYNNPLYNSLKWTKIMQWKKFVTTTPIINEPDDHRSGQMRGFQIETLWLREHL